MHWRWSLVVTVESCPRYMKRRLMATVNPFSRCVVFPCFVSVFCFSSSSASASPFLFLAFVGITKGDVSPPHHVLLCMSRAHVCLFSVRRREIVLFQDITPSITYIIDNLALASTLSKTLLTRDKNQRKIKINYQKKQQQQRERNPEKCSSQGIAE